MEFLVTMTTHVPPGPSDDTANDDPEAAAPPGAEFLTTFTVTVPEGTSAERLEETLRREAQRADELSRQGHLLRLWTLPGQNGTPRALGLWRAGDGAEMQVILRSLPMDPWIAVDTTPLTQHPSDPAIMHP